jgi:SAM-dependent methyltransferase
VEVDMSTAWGSMQPHDVARFGEVILDPEERKRWCTAILIGGLPYIWRELAPVPRGLFLDRLEIAPGDRVLLIGEGLEGIGIDAEIKARVGDGGEVVTVDFMERVRDTTMAGDWPQWQWPYTDGYADDHFDAIAIFQGVAHSDDWALTARELVRVLRPGRMVVLGEVIFGAPLAAVIRQDVHVTYVFQKIWEAIFPPGTSFEQMPYWSPEALTEAFSGTVEDPRTFVWRGVELLWGRKPGAAS